VAFGVLVVTRAHDDAIPEAALRLVEDVAQRVARALFNCEEAVNSGGGGGGAGGVTDTGLPEVMRDRLAGLSFVLEAIEALPRPALAPDQDRRYTEIAKHVATLEAQVQEFLTGHGGGR
jgi:hypothetical protein